MAGKLESSDSEADSYSCCSSDCEQDALWLEHVGSRGDLFYIEADIDSIKDDMKSTYIDGTHFEPTQLKMNAADKFKKWLRNRQKNIPKLLTKSKPEKESYTPYMYGSSMRMASKDFFVDIKPNEKSYPYKMQATAEVLGMCVNNISGDIYCPQNRLEIVGFVPGKEVAGIKIGDFLQAIDGVDVDLKNIDEVVNKIKSHSRVKLTVLHPLVPSCSKPRHKFSLIKELLGDPEALEKAKSQVQHVPHGLFYFMIDSEESENDGVVYRYPDKDSLLLQLKGMFITIALMIKDIATPPVMSCTVKIDEDLVHVGFLKEDEEIMLLVFPASRVTTLEVQYSTSSLAKLLKFQFQTLKKAFTIGNDEKRMDQFCILYFRHILSYSQFRDESFQPHFIKLIPTVQWIPLPAEITIEIDDVLSELESCDFQASSDGFSFDRRKFSIVGSCLFFKGYLISNHFPKNILLDVHLFLHHHHIFNLTKMKFVSDVIIWQEVFPTHLDDVSNSDNEYTRKHGRSILLVAGLHHAVLAVLLEDGGCAIEADDTIPPDPFYVEEVQNTLIILQDCALLADIESMSFVTLPPRLPMDFSYLDWDSGKSSLSKIFNSNATTSSCSNIHSVDYHTATSEKDGRKLTKSILPDKLEEVGSERQALISSMGPADGESDDESSNSDISSENEATGKSKRRCSISTGSNTGSQGSDEYFLSSGKIVKKMLGKSGPSTSQAYTDIPQESYCLTKNPRTLSGCGSTIFHYVHISNNEGIYLAPLDTDPCLLTDSAVQGVLRAFDVCCLKFRDAFLHSANNERVCKEQGRTPRGLSSLTQSVFEQSVMFEYTVKKHTKGKNKKFAFCVVGRLIPEQDDREVYVCHHSSTKRDVVEVAFRLGFGLVL